MTKVISPQYQQELLDFMKPENQLKRDQAYLKDPNHLDNWIGAVKNSGALYPHTEIFPLNFELYQELMEVYEGKRSYGELSLAYFKQIGDVAEEIGYPCFFRCSLTSNKHYWKDTCYLTAKEEIPRKIMDLLEFCLLGPGIRPSSFVVRKLIETRPLFYAFRGEMPITKERRYFVNNGEVVCHHPYWPKEAFINRTDISDPSWEILLEEMNSEGIEEVSELTRLAVAVSQHLEGYWSIDMLEDLDGKWWVIDLAKGAHSYHWKGCEFKLLPKGLNEEK